jgi:hypothetical protein
MNRRKMRAETGSGRIGSKQHLRFHAAHERREWHRCWSGHELPVAGDHLIRYSGFA